MPSHKSKKAAKEILASLVEVRRAMEARGIDVAARLKALGLEDDEEFDDPWTQAQPHARKEPK